MEMMKNEKTNSDVTFKFKWKILCVSEINFFSHFYVRKLELYTLNQHRMSQQNLLITVSQFKIRSRFLCLCHNFCHDLMRRILTAFTEMNESQF